MPEEGLERSATAGLHRRGAPRKITRGGSTDVEFRGRVWQAYAL